MKKESIYDTTLPQLPLLMDSISLFGIDGNRMLAVSAAMLSLAAPSNAFDTSRNTNTHVNQIVLMRCVAKSMPDEIIKRELREQLRDIQTLQPNWIEGAQPIATEAIAHMEELLEISQDLDFCGWELAPYINGTLLLHYNERNVTASINIAQNGASGYIESPSRYITIEETDFNVKDIYDLIWRLSPLNENRINA